MRVLFLNCRDGVGFAVYMRRFTIVKVQFDKGNIVTFSDRLHAHCEGEGYSFFPTHAD